MAIATFDKLNTYKVWEKRSMPYDKYFGEMDLSEDDKESRIRMAQILEPSFLFLFALIDSCIQANYLNEAFILSSFKEYYRSAITSQMQEDEYVTEYIDMICALLVETTIDNALKAEKERLSTGDELVAADYYMSEDRAMFMAEDEANSLSNYRDWKQAIADGKTKKTWHDFGDNRVRRTHRAVNNKTLPIKDAFMVGYSMLMFPGDTSLNASAEELIGCRCTIEYF